MPLCSQGRGILLQPQPCGTLHPPSRGGPRCSSTPWPALPTVTSYGRNPSQSGSNRQLQWCWGAADPDSSPGSGWAGDGAAGEAPGAGCKQSSESEWKTDNKGKQVPRELPQRSCPGHTPPPQQERPEQAGVCGQRAGPGQSTRESAGHVQSPLCRAANTAAARAR